MDLYSAIYHRQSVRRFKDGLNQEQLQAVEELITHLPRINETIDMDGIVIVQGEKIQRIMSGIIGNYGKIIAPHFIVITAEEKDGAYTNAGYAFEYLVLELTRMEVGSVWIGGHVDKKAIHDITNIKENHIPIAMIGFGVPLVGNSFAERNPNQLKRKSFFEIAEGSLNNDREKLINAVRMAPSAVNSQPWRFVFEEEKIHVYLDSGNILKKLILSTINQVDIGIAIAHLEIAAKKIGYTVNIAQIDYPRQKRSSYITSVCLKKK